MLIAGTWQPLARKTIQPIKYMIAGTFNAQFIPIVGVEKRGAYKLVHCDLPSQGSTRSELP